ncbi:MAG: AsmA family protein, partial [Gammaproteobacteria bacterium]|nr:AsmA family protein [Gammaproteobacteria bacterium]
MKALLKTIGIIIGIVIVLFVAIAIIVPIYFHPNDYKDEIAAAVQEKTGRELKIEGDIVLSVFPWLAVELGALELGNAPDFSDEKFASLEKMEIGVKLLPLLSKRLEMRAVTVHGLELNLAKDKKGQTNWADLAELLEHEDGKAKKQSEGEAKEDAKENGALPIAALGIGGLDIRDAALRWNDAQSAQQYQLEGLTIETGAITLGEAVDLAISFDMKGNKPQISGHIETKAKLTADLAANTYQLSGFDVVTRLAGEPIPNGKMALELKADISADLAEQTLRVENLRFATGQIDASGAMTVNQLMEAPAFDGKLQLQTFNPRTLLTEFGQQIPETADPKALTAVSLSATLKGTADRVRMEALTIQLDDTAMNGSLEVANFSAPAIRFNLDADAIDADRYLPPTEDKAAKPATPGTAASGATELPFEALRALNVNGKARLGKLTIAKLKLSDVALDVTAKGGVIKLSPVKMNLYEGNYAGNIGIDARGDKARITLDEKLANVQAGPLLNDLQGDDILSGKVQFALDLKTVGATPEDFKKTLNGQADFTFENGMVKG